MNTEELEKLYDKIMRLINCYNPYADALGAKAKQRAIIKKIDECPEVLRVQSRDWGYRTIGIQAAKFKLLYVTMRALQDAEACALRNKWGDDIFDTIKLSDDFYENVVNSPEHKELIKNLENDLATAVVTGDEYDSIME